MKNPTIDPIVQRLQMLAKSSPDLKQAADIYEIILPIIRDYDLHVQPIALAEEQVRRKLEAGVPLLRRENLVFDTQAAKDLVLELARALEKKNVAVKKVRAAILENKLDVKKLMLYVMAGEEESFAALVEELQLETALLRTLAQHALKPALREWRRQLEPLARSIDWQRGYCFVCGSPAIFGELRDNDQSKHVRCGQCGADWACSRMQCVYCGNRDSNTFGYFYPENQRDKLRIEACDGCHGYLKVISSFSPTSVDMLPVEDLATLHLDFIAQERGYVRIKQVA